jgi:hypothetical protein
VTTTQPSDYDLYAAELARYTEARGIKTYLRHRTTEEYLDAFLGAGLRLTKLADSVANCFQPGPETILPDGGRFPRFMLLRFTKP